MSKKLLKSAAVVSSMTLISRILGLVRDIVLARYIGVNAGMDAFFIAFKIPNFMRRLFAEGAFSQAFVPVFSEYKTQRSHQEVRQLSQDVAGTLGGILFLVTLVGVIAAPILVTIFAPGFYNKQDQFDLTVELLRFTFPYIFFISLTALAGGILNTYDRFAVPAFSPVLLYIVSYPVRSIFCAAVFESGHGVSDRGFCCRAGTADVSIALSCAAKIVGQATMGMAL